MQKEAKTRETATVVITGANSGLGYECAKSFLKGEWNNTVGWHVVMACRDLKRANEALDKMKREVGEKQMKQAGTTIEVIQCDLGSIASIRNFAKTVVDNDGEDGAQRPALKALVLNAGLQFVNGLNLTEDGFEATFGINHLGHFLLAHLLMRHLKPPHARIIFVSSGTHDPEQKTGVPIPHYTSARQLAFPQKTEEADDGDKGKDKEATEGEMKIGQCRYSTSKLCNVLCAYEMVRRLKKTDWGKEDDDGVPVISVAAFDPGLMPGTGLARDYGSLMQFAWNYVLPVARIFVSNVNSTARSGSALARLAADTSININNKYYEGRRDIPSSEESYDEEKAKELWEGSIELVGLKEDEQLLP